MVLSLHPGPEDWPPSQPSSGSPASAPPPKRGFFRRAAGKVGWLLSSPSDWAGFGSIKRGANLIGDLARASRSEPGRRERVYVADDRAIDFQATAFSAGLSVDGLRHRLEVRRRQTAQIAYAMFALACLFLVGWLRSALNAPLTTSRIMVTIDFVPFGALFFLLAFYNALLNFQIRTGRRASWREYLLTNEGFWPR